MKKTNLKTWLLAVLLLVSVTAKLFALTTGDIAILAVQTDAPKMMTFVALADIPANTSISFTDNAWDATTETWRTGEGTITWSHTDIVASGTVVSLIINTSPFIASLGTITTNTSFNLSASGDQILAYEGIIAPTTNTSSIWLFGFSTENFVWANTSNTSDLPLALTGASVGMTTSITETDNAYFANGTVAQTEVSVSGTKNDLLILFTDESKYLKSNDIIPFPTYTVIVTNENVSAPTIQVSPGTLSGFTYQFSTGPSTEQTFTVSGINLTNDISIAASTNFEISKTSGTGFTTSLTFAQNGGIVSEQLVYVRLKADLAIGNYFSEVFNITSNGATTKTITSSGSVTVLILPEPASHATNFVATANSGSQITVTWTDATSVQVPEGYLVKVAVAPAQPATPSDGTVELDSYLVKNVYQGVGQAIFTGLNEETTYNFSIWPFTNSGSNINYKTDGTVPTAQEATLVPVITTYTWIGGTSGAWTTSTNWSPERITPETTDVIQFNDGATILVTDVISQTIRQMSVTNNTKVTLQTVETCSLTIAGGFGTDLLVDGGSELNISGTIPLQIPLLSGATGSISGSMTFSNGAHRLTAADASGIIFNSGSKFTTGTGFMGSAFGTTSSNSIIFSNGSVYEHNAGIHPFGAGTLHPNYIVVLQTGSLYRHKTTTPPSFARKTFSNFELDINGVMNGSLSELSFDNLTIVNGICNLNISAGPGLSIKGNIFVADGAVLNLNTTTEGAVYLNGTSEQTISGTGTISLNSNLTLEVNNAAGVVIDNNIIMNGNLTITSGTLQVNPAKQLTLNGAFVNNSTLELLSDQTGTATILTPSLITGSGAVNVQQYLSSGRNWYMSSPLTNAVALNAFVYKQYNEPNGSLATNWTTVNENGTLIPGKGYTIQPTGTTTYNFGTANGQLNSGDVEVTLTRTTGVTNEGFNLVGNPYPSYLNISALLNNDVETSYWLQTRNAGNSAWVYDAYNKSGDVAVNNSGNAVTNSVPSMQSFWVKVKDGVASTNLTFTNTMRSHKDVINNRFRAPTNMPLLRFEVTDGTNSDQAVLYFNTNASDTFDDYDTRKIFNNTDQVPEIYTTAGTRQLMINGMNTYGFGTMVPLGFNAGQTGNFSIRASEVSNFDSDTRIVLLDAQLGSQFDLSTGNTYSFASDAVSGSDRFTVTFKSISGTTECCEPTTNSGMYVVSQQARIMLNCNTEPSADACMTIYNAVGQKLHSQSVYSNNTVSTRTFEAGVYVVKVDNAGKSFVMKTIIR